MICIASGVHIFHWEQERIEVHPDAVDNGSISVVVATKIGSTKKDQNGNWLDSSWWVVLFLPGCNHLTKEKILVDGLV